MLEAAPAIDFLLLSYRGIDFLMPQSEVLASTVRTPAGSVPTALKNLGELISYSEKRILDFDLGALLCGLFPDAGPRPSELSLICSPALFRRGLATTDRLLTSDPPALFSGQLFALSVSPDSHVIRLGLGELRLFPSPLRARLASRGLIGLRLGEARPQYLLDVCSLIEATVFAREREGAPS